MKAVCVFLISLYLLCLFFFFPLDLWADRESPYGINAHIPVPEDEDTAGEPSLPLLDLVQQAGIGWIRADFNWYMIEPVRGKPEWGRFDTLVSGARERGIQIFATLSFTPAWANGGGRISDPPHDPGDWYAFVFDVVERYREHIQHWGMWNEPNLDKFWSGTRGQYREWILKGGSQAARAADPSCQVVAPGLAHIAGTRWWEWLTYILEGDGKEYVDIVSHHCYANSAEDVIRLLETGDNSNPSLREVLKQAGAGDKPFWLTETGWHTQRRSLDESWSGPPLPGHHYRLGDVSEELQAYNYQKLCWELIQRDWFDRVFFYELWDNPSLEVDNWGILRADTSPKQAYYAYRDFIANPQEPGSPAGGCTCRTGHETARGPYLLQHLTLQLLFGGLIGLFIHLQKRCRRSHPASAEMDNGATFCDSIPSRTEAHTGEKRVGRGGLFYQREVDVLGQLQRQHPIRTRLGLLLAKQHNRNC